MIARKPALFPTRAGLLLAGAAFAAALAAAPAPAAAQSSPGWFVPQPAAPASPAGTAPRGKAGRHAVPAAEPSADLPPPGADAGPGPAAGPDPSDEAAQAEAQAKAANLPQPPAPPLPPIVSPLSSAAATGDAVKVAATPGATLPGPLNADTTYYLIKSGEDDFKLAATPADAAAGTAIVMDTNGSGHLKLILPTARNGQTNLSAEFVAILPKIIKTMPGVTAPPTVAIGVLGVPDVMRASSAAQAVEKVVGARKERLQLKVQRAQAGWRELEQQLQADAPKLTREQLLARERELRARVNADRHQLQEENRIVQEAAQVALGQIERTLVGVVRQVAESRGINMVLHRSQVVLNIQEFDITDAVVAQLNKALPTVQIPADNVDPATLPKDWGTTPVAAH